jgi:hypothetical protein
MSIDNIDWKDIIKNEARGLKDDDLGEVQEVRQNEIITKVGVVDKEAYCIPKKFVTPNKLIKSFYNIYNEVTIS